MPLDLASFDAKLGRAKHHTEAVENEIIAWLNPKPYRLSPKVNADATRHSVIIHIDKIAPVARWSLVIGDAIHNIRSALDHFVYTIAVHESRQNPPPNERVLAFPICDCADIYRKSKWRIETLSDDVRTAIERVQPYNRPHPPLPPLLAMLRDFDDADKHRLLTPMFATAYGGEVNLFRKGGIFLGSRCIEIFVNDGELKDGTEIMAVTFDRATPNVKIDGSLTFMFALRHAKGRDDFNALLRMLTAEVRAVKDIVIAAVKI